MDRRAVPRDFEFVPKLRRTSQDPRAQSSVSPIAYVTRPHQWKMDKIPPWWAGLAGILLFLVDTWQTGFLPFPATDGEFRPFEVNSSGVPVNSRRSRPKFGDSRHEDVQ